MDREALAQQLREVVQQYKALGARFDALVRALDQEAAVEGSSGLVCPYEEIVKEWNARCAAVGMKRRHTAGELRVRILGRWRKHPNIDLWRAAFDACAHDDWWSGRRGDWRGSLESFLVPKHADRWFDAAAGAQAEPAVGPLFQEKPHGQGGPEPERAAAYLEEILSGKRPLPHGYDGMNPVGCPPETTEYRERVRALKDWLENDWRFA